MKLVLKAAFLLFIFFLMGCKKGQKDTQPPKITFTTPTIGQSFKMFDTILVSAHVSDNQHLASVNVTLTDVNHIPQQASYNVPVQSADFVLTIDYILTQFHLSTGNYYMQITADDGYNTTAIYQSIYITESPTLMWGYCAVLKSSPTLISYYDTVSGTTNSSPIMLTQSYHGMKYGGYNAQLYVNGNTNQQFFQAYSMQSKSILPYYKESDNNYAYTCLYTDGNKPYVGYKNGDIYSYDYTGNPSTSYRNNNGNTTVPPYPYYFTTTSIYGVGVFRDPTSIAKDQLVIFYGGSGAFFESATIAAPSCNITNVIAVFEKSQDSLYVLGNDVNNQAAAYIFSPSVKMFTPINMPAGKLLSAVKVNNENIIFSTNSSVYSCINLNYTPLSASGAQKLSYQPKLNMLTMASGSNLNAYTVGSTSLSPIPTRSLVLGDSIVDFEVITNK